MSSAIAAAAAGALVAGSMSKKSSQPSGQQTTTNKVELDPRMQELVYGSGRSLRDGVTPTYGEDTQRWVGGADDGISPSERASLEAALGVSIPGGGGYYETIKGTQNNPESDYTNDTGILGKITGLLDQEQKPGMTQIGQNMDNYLKNWGEDTFVGSQRRAQALQGSDIQAPQMGAANMGAANMGAAQINAPGQNNLDLSGSYDSMINGDPGNNPYLTGAIQKGINQSSNAFGNYLTDATKNVQDVMGGIRGGAIINGSMGGSRQGIAEGKAADSYIQNITRAASQFGQNNTDAAVSAQAGAYDQDRNRSLNAMQGLGSQQYNVAGQNAGFEQQANANNAGWQQQANAANAGYQQQANVNNQQSQLSTNQLNSANQLQGTQISSGLLGQAYGYGTNNDGYDISRTGQISNLVTPYTGLGGTSSTSPLYSNRAGNVMGGATMGLGLLNAYNQSGGFQPNAGGTGYNPYAGYNAAANGGWGIE